MTFNLPRPMSYRPKPMSPLMQLGDTTRKPVAQFNQSQTPEMQQAVAARNRAAGVNPGAEAFDLSKLQDLFDKAREKYPQVGQYLPGGGQGFMQMLPGVGGFMQSFLGGYHGASGANQGVSPENRTGLVAELMNRWRLRSPSDWASRTTVTPSA